MGSGKTEVGRHLERLTGLSFIDSDAEIENQKGQSISAIFKQYGEPYFRTLEHKFCQNLSKKEPFILSTGGGLILKKENVHLLSETGKIFFLDSPFEVMLERILRSTKRPLAQNEEQLKQLWKKRHPIYCAHSDVQLSTKEKTSDQIAEEIIGLL